MTASLKEKLDLSHPFFVEAVQRDGMFFTDHFLEKMASVKGHASDLDGTLLLNEKFALNQMQSVIETYLKVELPPGLVVAMAGKSKNEIISACAHAGGLETLSAGQVAEILNLITMARATLRSNESIQEMHGAANYFYKISRHENIPTIIATSSERPRVELHLSHHGALRSHFTHAGQLRAICAETDLNGVVKPDPLVYTEAAKALGLNSHDMATYEDSVSGVFAAKAAGIGTIVGITGGDHIADSSYHAKELLAAGADATFPTFTHLAQVVHPFDDLEYRRNALDKVWHYFYQMK